MHSLRRAALPRSILVVAAHPNDIEFMAGGTLAAWVDQGVQIHYLLVTDGVAGSRELPHTYATLVAQRRREQRVAAAIVGVESITFLGYRDSEVEASHALRQAIAQVIRHIQPETVLTFDPHRYYRSAGIVHPDHLAVAASTLAALMPLANSVLAGPALADEGCAPHDIQAIYLFDPAAPTNWIPLTLRDVERKIAALQAHTSQRIEWDDAAAYESMRHMAQAARAQGVWCVFAEAFTCVQLAPPAQHAETAYTITARVQFGAQAGIAWLRRAVQLAVTRLAGAAELS